MLKTCYVLNDNAIKKVYNIFNSSTANKIIDKVNNVLFIAAKNDEPVGNDFFVRVNINNQIIVNDIGYNPFEVITVKFNKNEDFKSSVIKLNHNDIKPGIWYSCGEIDWDNIYKCFPYVNICFYEPRIEERDVV